MRHLGVDVAVAGAEVAQQARAQRGVRGRLARRRAELRDARVLDAHQVEEVLCAERNITRPLTEHFRRQTFVYACHDTL